MVKKYAILAMLGLMAVLALSAFSPVNYRPVISNAYNITDVSLRALPALNSAPISSDDNFRIAHTWNGIKIPALDVTSFLPGLQAYEYGPISIATGSAVRFSSVSNFRIAHTWNGRYIPSMNATGLLEVGNTPPTGVVGQFASFSGGSAAVSRNHDHANVSVEFKSSTSEKQEFGPGR